MQWAEAGADGFGVGEAGGELDSDGVGETEGNVLILLGTRLVGDGASMAGCELQAAPISATPNERATARTTAPKRNAPRAPAAERGPVKSSLGRVA